MLNLDALSKLNILPLVYLYINKIGHIAEILMPLLIIFLEPQLLDFR